MLLILLLLRELIKVGQRNFRKYMSMREWGWFIIIQKTRPLIGRSVIYSMSKSTSYIYCFSGPTRTRS